MSISQTSQSTGRRVLRFLPWLIPIAGDHAAAVVLGQIMYWHEERLRIERHGHLWLVKSRADMCEECGITLDQYKRIIPRLQRLGLIVCERGLYKNKVTPFLRLTDRGLMLLNPNQSGGKSSAQLGDKDPNPSAGTYSNRLATVSPNSLANGDHTPLTEMTSESLTETTAGICSRNTTGQKPDATQEKQVEAGIQEVSTEKSPKKSCDAQLETSKPVADGVMAMIAAWKEIAGRKSQAYVKNLTRIEVGQLRHVLKALGPESAMKTMRYALENWSKFSHEAAALKGVYPAVSPACWYFCKYHDVAVNMQQPVESISQSTPIAMVTAIKPREEFDLATEEQVIKSLESLMALNMKKKVGDDTNIVP